MPTVTATARLHTPLTPPQRKACSSLRFNNGGAPHHFLYKGYRLAYAEFGAMSGTPDFYFHDSGSSRLEASLLHQSAQRDGFRIIAIDRPGIGQSEFYRYERPAEFCTAVRVNI